MRAKVALAWPYAQWSKPLGCWENLSDPNPEPVDIIIPVLPKDLDVLPIVVAGIRENFSHPIACIYIVAPESEHVRHFCSNFGCTFVDERQVNCLRPEEIQYNYRGRNRSKWIYQQLLKLSADIGTSKWYFISDADTVLIRPHLFRIKDRHVFYQLPVIHLPYRYAYHTLIGRRAKQALTFVSHMMMFSREKIKQMHRHIESRHNLRWDEAIVSIIDEDELSCFADYETYGTYIYQTEGATTFPLYNTELKRDKLLSYDLLKNNYNKITGTLSFHAWLSEK
jgi:hypothetical protein